LDLLKRLERVTGHKPHRLLRRGLFFAHRGLEEILDDFEAGRPIFLYTGRGPSGDMHVGHVIPMEFTVWLQKVFKAVVVFQIADDEKYWFKDKTWEEIYELGKKNVYDIIALGFDPERTFIFSNRDFSRNEAYQRVAFDMLNHVRVKDIKSIFGIKDESLSGQLMWPVYQSTAAFSKAFGPLFRGKNVRCLVAYAIDQDPYFRLCRDVAPKLGFMKPCSIMCRFLPALEGDAKMSTTAKTGPPKAVFMHDTPTEIASKIKKYAFSGGRDTLAEHREHGGNTEVDVSYQWLRHFLEDDEQLADIKARYESGEMLTGELKKLCADVVTEMILEHQHKKAQVTEEVVNSFYSMDNIRLY
ncbi:MAG: tryptophan--tRNA ligase, partial [Candidatus Aenigmarchaeota archaeon]|nr:tryptophan--tRNA ligase [Candidatus Aenigmarchaeota archaeon]